MKRILPILCLSLFAHCGFSQWVYNSTLDPTSIDIVKKDKISIVVFDIVKNNYAESEHLSRLISDITSNSIDTSLFLFKIIIRTGVSLNDNACYKDEQYSYDSITYYLKNSYPVILIDSTLIMGYIDGLTENDKLLYDKFENTPYLRIAGDSHSQNYAVLYEVINSITDFYVELDSFLFQNYTVSLNPLAYNPYLKNYNRGFNNGDFTIGIDYTYWGVNKKYLYKNLKHPQLGIGFGLNFSKYNLNTFVENIEQTRDSMIDRNNNSEKFKLLLFARNVKEDIILNTFNMPLFFSFRIWENKNLFLKTGISFSYLFGNINSTGIFTYKGLYNDSVLIDDENPYRRDYIREKYGFYSNYPKKYTQSICDTNFFKKYYYSIFAEINHRIKVTDMIDFFWGVNYTLSENILNKNNTPENYIISTDIENYSPLILNEKKYKLATFSIKTGLVFKL